MGNSLKTVKFIENQNSTSKKLCWLDKDTNEFKKENSLLDYLKLNGQQEIKIITVIGSQGHGKSTFLNFLLYEFTKEPIAIFKMGEKLNPCTIGINYFTLEVKKILYLFFDCQGFDDSNYNPFEKKIKHLTSLICRISTCTFHLTSDIRMSDGFKFLVNNYLNFDQNRSFKNIISNFIEVINQKQTAESKNVNFEDLFQRTFILQQQQQVYSKKNKYLITEEFDSQIKEMVKIIKESTYNSQQQTFKPFTDKQISQTFQELLISSFQILKDQNNLHKEFMQIIQMQLEMKISFEEQNKELENQCAIRIKKLFENKIFKQKKCLSIFLFTKILQFNLDELNNTISNRFQGLIHQWRQNFQVELSKILNGKTPEELNQIINEYDNIKDLQPKQIKELSFKKNFQFLPIFSSNSLNTFQLMILSQMFLNQPIINLKMKKEIKKKLLNFNYFESIDDLQGFFNKQFKNFSNEFDKLDEQKKFPYLILMFFNLKSSTLSISQWQKYKTHKPLYLEIMKKYINSKDMQEAIIDFKIIQQLKFKGLQQSDFKFINGEMTIKNDQLLSLIYYDLNSSNSQNLFKILVILRNLSKQFLIEFIYDTKYKNMPQALHFNPFQEQNILDFLIFQENSISVEI